jgi:hypothetical protein
VGCDAIRDYSAFGGVLRSEIYFPELSVAGPVDHPDWSLRVAAGPPRDVRRVFIGERRMRDEQYRLWRCREGLRLEYSHAGSFDISNDGSLIVWYHNDGAAMELVRNIVLGPAIALALELAGFFCLHASAVALAGQAIAFVGPKYFGKSTLATALTAAGGQLVGDDLIVVRPGPPATVRPGVASVRLWPDIAEALPLRAIGKTLIPGVKTTLTGFNEQSIASSPILLKSIYVLSPVKEHERDAWRTAIAPSEATVALAHQTKLPDSLIGLQAAGSQLALAAAVAAAVPVWRLHIVRDVTRLARVVQQIIEWSTAG